MTRDMANTILQKLIVWYPKTYNSDSFGSEKKKLLVEDFMIAFKGYTDEQVESAFLTWHFDNNRIPTVADIRAALSKTKAGKELEDGKQWLEVPYTGSGIYANECILVDTRNPIEMQRYTEICRQAEERFIHNL